METFEEWFESHYGERMSWRDWQSCDNMHSSKLYMEKAWNHQQQKIDKLEAQNKKLDSINADLDRKLTKAHQDKAKLVECVKFYGSEGAYRSKHGGHIENRNFHSPIGQDCGKRARQCLKDLGIGEGE